MQFYAVLDMTLNDKTKISVFCKREASLVSTYKQCGLNFSTENKDYPEESQCLSSEMFSYLLGCVQ